MTKHFEICDWKTEKPIKILRDGDFVEFKIK
jgi:hypothetical protein